MENLAESFMSSADALTSCGASASDLQALGDAELLVAQERIAVHRRALDAYAAWVAGEIARRSRRDLGYAGLAQREGFGTPERLIQSMSSTSRREAAKFVEIGTMMADTQAAKDVQDLLGRDGASNTDGRGGEQLSTQLPWQAPIADAVAAGGLSADAAEAIRAGLGNLDDVVNPENLSQAARHLVNEATNLNVEQLHRRARAVRDELDEDGIARREKERRDQRYLKTWWQADGMYRVSGLLDPESGLMLDSALSTILSPRTGGPRFVKKDEKERAQRLVDDPRTNEQIAVDALVEMVRIAGDVDESTIFGSRRPAVRVIVPIETAETNAGHGFFQDHPDPVSSDTVDRYLCSGGSVLLGFDGRGQPVDVGRNQRLFTARQRIALAVRDGGCRWPGCDRPASWTEAHHTNHWHRDHGRTDLVDGVLLCRHHHMLLHNNGWHVLRDGGDYWLRPPQSVDSRQRLRAMPSKSPSIEGLRVRPVLQWLGNAGQAAQAGQHRADSTGTK